MLRNIQIVFSYLFFVLIATYPISDFRIWEQPYPVLCLPFLILGFLGHLFISKKKAIGHRNYILFLISFSGIVLISSIIFSTDLKLESISTILVFSSLPLFTNYLLDDKKRKNIIRIWTLSSLFICLYGLYGFITWETGEVTEHLIGYFGVSYTGSTRNTDLLYFIFPFCFFSSKAFFGKQRYFLFNIIITIGLLLVIFLTQSRGGIVAIILALITIPFFIRIRLKYGILRRLLGLIFTLSIVGFFFLEKVPKDSLDLAYNRFSMLASMERGHKKAYNSNLDRLYILNSSFKTIIEYPFGIGISNSQYYLSDLKGNQMNHSENMYVTLWVEIGLLGVLVFTVYLVLSINAIIRYYNKVGDEYAFFLLFLFICYAYYGFFNLMIDSLWYWSIFILVPWKYIKMR